MSTVRTFVPASMLLTSLGWGWTIAHSVATVEPPAMAVRFDVSADWVVLVVDASECDETLGFDPYDDDAASMISVVGAGVGHRAGVPRTVHLHGSERPVRQRPGRRVRRTPDRGPDRLGPPLHQDSALGAVRYSDLTDLLGELGLWPRAPSA